MVDIQSRSSDVRACKEYDKSIIGLLCSASETEAIITISLLSI
jgi:hypothetical protein